MSRVHDALRKAQPIAGATAEPPPGLPRTEAAPGHTHGDLLAAVKIVPFNPSPDASLLDPARPGEAPAEEFRSLRTRLNHIQTLQPIHSLVITSPSPAEGKSFTAANLALAQAQLENNFTLLADFDFRRPVVHTLFQLPRSPGITDYLQGKATLDQIIQRLEGTNLFVMTAGEAVLNPLELLNLPAAKSMIENLPEFFNWVIIDTPPLLFAADANLLSTMAHALLLVVRIGSTTIDSVTRAMASLCHNNILGIVVNAAQRSELYSKYTYYHSYYTAPES
ncbi:MAG: CpsD/CapB family tyrosine-protein kinase [Bryobacteraceae bacterium]